MSKRCQYVKGCILGWAEVQRYIFFKNTKKSWQNALFLLICQNAWTSEADFSPNMAQIEMDFPRTKVSKWQSKSISRLRTSFWDVLNRAEVHIRCVKKEHKDLHFDDFYVFWRFPLQPYSTWTQPGDLTLFSPLLVGWNTTEIILCMRNSCFEVGLKSILWN